MRERSVATHSAIVDRVGQARVDRAGAVRLDDPAHRRHARWSSTTAVSPVRGLAAGRSADCRSPGQYLSVADELACGVAARRCGATPIGGSHRLDNHHAAPHRREAPGLSSRNCPCIGPGYIGRLGPTLSPSRLGSGCLFPRRHAEARSRRRPELRSDLPLDRLGLPARTPSILVRAARAAILGLSARTAPSQKTDRQAAATARGRRQHLTFRTPRSSTP